MTDATAANSPPGPPRPSEADLAMMQRLVLDAGLGGSALPGIQQSVRLADLALLQEEDGSVLLDPVGAELISVSRLAVPVRREPPEASGRPFVRIRSSVTDSGEVTVALDAVAPAREGLRPLGLGTLVVRFARGDNGWHVVGSPGQLAS